MKTRVFLKYFVRACNHSPLCLNMYHLVFPRLEQFVKLVDWMGFSIIFR